jgi:hypothetical protein
MREAAFIWIVTVVIVCLLMVPLLSLFLIGTPSHAQPALSAPSLIVVPFAAK